MDATGCFQHNSEVLAHILCEGSEYTLSCRMMCTADLKNYIVATSVVQGGSAQHLFNSSVCKYLCVADLASITSPIYIMGGGTGGGGGRGKIWVANSNNTVNVNSLLPVCSIITRVDMAFCGEETGMDSKGWRTIEFAMISTATLRAQSERTRSTQPRVWHCPTHFMRVHAHNPEWILPPMHMSCS